MQTYRIKRKYTQCSNCPLNGMNKVYGESGSEKPRIAIIGEAPGANEDSEGHPFVGPAGRWLYKALDAAGIPSHKVHKSNVIICRPPKNDLSSMEGDMAKENCRTGFIDEIRALADKGVKVFIPVGNHAMEALGIDGKISKMRGSVYLIDEAILPEGKERGIIALPTYHPSYIMRGQVKEEPIWISDLHKAKVIAREGWTAPKEDFNIFPSLEDVLKFRDKVVKNKITLGVDIETTSLNSDHGVVWCIGFAINGETAMVAPFYKRGKHPYWKDVKDRMRVQKAVGDILKECPTIWQNALFDVEYLESKGYEIGNIKDDTMLLHHAISPELPHNLGFIVSVYGRTPYWKDIVLNSEEKIAAQDDTEFRTYNARDAVVLKQVLPELKKDLKNLGSTNIYEEISKKLIRPVIAMKRNGMYINDRERIKFRKELRSRIDENEKRLYEMADLDPNISLSSPDDQRYIFYGQVPAKYERALTKLEEYKDNPKLKKNTKKYANLISTTTAIEKTQPLYKTSAQIKRTTSGAKSIDSEALLQIQVAANRRIDKINKFRNPKPHHEEEKKEIEKLLKFIEVFRQWKDDQKMLSTFTSYPVGKDGRVHFSYKIHGTNTGRLASGGKGTPGNAQNIPKEAKKIFQAEEGNVIIQADYSNLELRVLAYESKDDVLKKTFAEGKNVHSENCKLLFQIDENHHIWDSARRASKVYIFGRNYGGTLRGVYQKVIKDVPELRLTEKRFKEIDATYRDHHPMYAKWYDETVDKVKSTRELRNAFGRVRYFNGTESEIVREGLNFPIQSLAADIMNIALIKIYDEFVAKFHLEAKLIGTVHDSILVECPKGNAEKVMRIMKNHMEAEYEIHGEDVSFPVDFEVGTNWKDVEKVEVK